MNDSVTINEALWKEKWQTTETSQLAKIFTISKSQAFKINKRLGLKRTKEQLSKFASNVYSDTRATRKKKSRGYGLAIGAVSQTKNKSGRITMRVKTKNGWQDLHIYNWIGAGKTIPNGFVVTFINGDRTNCSVDNLELKRRSAVTKQWQEEKGYKPPVHTGEKRITDPNHQPNWIIKRKQEQAEKKRLREEAMLEKQKVKEQGKREKKQKRISKKPQKELKVKLVGVKSIPMKVKNKTCDLIIVNKKRAVRKAKLQKKIPTVFPTKIADYTQKKYVRINDKTVIEINLNEDPQTAIEKYYSLHKKQSA